MRRSAALAIVAALAGTLVTGAVAAPAGAALPAGYSPSLVDQVPPTVVEARVKALAGKRFITLRVDDKAGRYVATVLGATPAEARRFEAQLSVGVPVVVETGSVSRAALDAALVAARAATASVDGIVNITPSYASGELLVSVPQKATVPTISRLVRSAVAASTKARAARSHSSLDAVAPRVVVAADRGQLMEGATSNPYRAGKTITVAKRGGGSEYCTASFTVNKGGKRYGLTAGHCGEPGFAVTFAGTKRGAMQNNSYYAANPSSGDVAAFAMAADSSATLYRSSTLNRKVSGSFAASKLKSGLTVCMRGAKSADQHCGEIYDTDLSYDFPDIITGKKHTIKHLTCFFGSEKNGQTGAVAGDSGAPVYRVQSDNSVLAVGIFNGVVLSGEIACFTPIGAALSATGSSLATS